MKGSQETIVGIERFQECYSPVGRIVNADGTTQKVVVRNIDEHTAKLPPADTVIFIAEVEKPKAQTLFTKATQLLGFDIHENDSIYISDPKPIIPIKRRFYDTVGYESEHIKLDRFSESRSFLKRRGLFVNTNKSERFPFPDN